MSERFFSSLGRLVTRYRVMVIVIWFALVVLVTLFAPNLDQVTSSDIANLLPTDAPFNQAFKVLAETFPAANAQTNAAIVLETVDGSVREGAAWKFIDELTAWLKSAEAEDNITEVLSPAGNSALLSDAMIAEDNQVAIVLVYLSTDSQSAATQTTLDSIGAYLKANTPSGSAAYVTGMAPIGAGYTEEAMTSVERTTGITIVLVVLILLLVYRSPVSPFVPLLTVASAYLISRGILAWIGQGGVTISSYTSVFLVVVLFGAGTDYCLFLISRFREEMADQAEPVRASQRTVRAIGETLTSSAGTVIVGFATMIFSELGLFRNSGPLLAIAIVVALLAGLTLTPALLSLLGQRVFWPGHAQHRDTGRLYERVAALVCERPVWTIVIIGLVLAPLALSASAQRSSYNMLDDLPADNEARLGYYVLAAHMGGGQMQPLDIVIRDLTPDTALAEIAAWTADLRAVAGVQDVRSLNDPLGTANDQLQGITRVDRQLTLAADLIGQLRAGEQQIDATQMTAAMSAIPFAREYLDALAAQFPQVADSEDLAGIRSALDGVAVAALTGRLDETLETLQGDLSGLAAAFTEVENAYCLPSALPSALVEALGGEDPLVTLSARYLTADRTAAHFEVILSGNPFSPEAMDAVSSLRAIIPGGTQAVSGSTVVMADLRDTMSRDLTRAFAFVLLGVFLVLVLLLRALVAPIYLILTILFSYGATMGITRLASLVFFGTEELTWWVPFFMFVLLVALGMDYNIFLMGRVREEAAHAGVHAGIRRALAATGMIITSAGIIMAGTFAAMMSGTLVGLRQLGLAVSVGVLLDTFVIRTALVPAIAVLLDHWNWWPGGAPRRAEAGEPDETAVAAARDEQLRR